MTGTLAVNIERKAVMRNFPAPRTEGTEDVRGIDRLLDEYEVSDLLGVKVGTLRFWRKQRPGRGPSYVKLGSLVRYGPEDLRKYLRKHSVQMRSGGTGQTSAAEGFVAKKLGVGSSGPATIPSLDAGPLSSEGPASEWLQRDRGRVIPRRHFAPLQPEMVGTPPPAGG